MSARTWFWLAFVLASALASERAPNASRAALDAVVGRGKTTTTTTTTRRKTQAKTKTRAKEDEGEDDVRWRARSIACAWSRARVPHRMFAHFYVVGVVANARACATHWKRMANANANEMEAMTAIAVVLGLFQLHIIRRLYESAFVAVYGAEATMHVGAYVLGLAYYAVASQTWASVAETSAHDDARLAMSKSLRLAVAFAGAWLFAYGSINQYRCHAILANLRRAKRSRDAPSSRSYFIPRGGWFERFSCAHYTAEVVLYCGLLLIIIPQLAYASDVFGTFARAREPAALVAAVVANLSVAASRAHAWYLGHFPHYPKNRTAMFPSTRVFATATATA